MPENKRRYGLMIILVSIAVLVGAGGGVLAARELARTRPTCTNAVNSYFDVMPERQRYLFERTSEFGRDAYIQTCREGRWSEAMKSCWVEAGSVYQVNECVNEWLNARPICTQMSEAAAALARRCRKELPAVDCRSVTAIGLGMKTCLEALRDVPCNEIDTVKETCADVLSRP